ncbi:MAG: FAD-dependent oxidoreductase [Bacteroidia bacterium]
MAKSHLVQMIRRTFQVAKQASLHSSYDKSEIIQQAYQSGINRRKFLGNTIKGAALLAFGSSLLESCAKDDLNDNKLIIPNSSNGPKIAIIGAGIAGLNCAYQLKKAGYMANIYEASSRHGGRMFTGHSIIAPGISTDLGGEFVDSNHKHLLDLVAEFGINLIDRTDSLSNGLEKEVYFFNNTFYTEADVIAALAPVALTIQADIDSLPDTITADEPGSAMHLDNISLEQYISGLNCAAWLKELLTVAYVTEYGREAGDQSCINMLFLLSVDTSNGFEMYGSSNERYKIAGGSQSVPNKLAQVLNPHVHYENSLVQVSRKNSGKYNLSFAKQGSATLDVVADIVVFALPFTTLRDVTFTFPLPSWKRHAINHLGYGTNAKLITGYNTRHWQTLGKAGEAFTDQAFQIGWDSSELQNTKAGAYSFFMGGKAGLDLGNGTEQFQYDQLKGGLEKVFPGIGAHHNGNIKRAHWPSNPFSKAAYACYTPGQWTTIAGNERKTVDSLYFCGEHCSINFQGFMNGGAETGYKTAQKIIASL